MRLGFIIPTNIEARNLNLQNAHVSSIGCGAGKAAACAAAANLIFNKHCDTIVIWGAAGALSSRVPANAIVVANRVAYRDYDIAPLQNSTGVGWVQYFAEKVFVDLDRELCSLLKKQLETFFPQKTIMEGTICTGDQFVQYDSKDMYNRVEKASDIVDMETAAAVHFCKLVNPSVKVGAVRFISDNADHTASVDFNRFLEELDRINPKMFDIRKAMTGSTGKVFNGDLRKAVSDRAVFEDICHKLYDEFNISHPGSAISKIAGIESGGFIFGMELAKMFNVPFVPVLRSESGWTIPENVLSDADNVLLVDDILKTGRTMAAARKAIVSTGAVCTHGMAVCRTAAVNGLEKTAGENFHITCLQKC